MSLVEDIKRQEAYRSHVYKDSLGILTIGYGLNLEDGISEPLAAAILEWIVEERRATLSKLLPFWGKLTPARQDVFLNMAYNLGIPRFLNFQKMLLAASQADIEGVCREMQDSKWYRQVGNRAKELVEAYRKG